MSWFARRSPIRCSARASVQRLIRPHLEQLEERCLPIAPTTLLGPSGFALPQPTFSWAAVSGASYYNIALQDEQNSQVTQAGNLTATTWVPSGSLNVGDTYQWLVQDVDSAGNTATSSLMTFVVSSLTAPTVLSPVGSSPPQCTLSWAALTGAAQYDVWLQDASTGNVQQGTGLTGTAWSPASLLTLGDNYTWWVRGIDSNGLDGPWSSATNFGVTDLAAPVLLAPSGAVEFSPTFTWNAVSGASTYDIWVQDQNTGIVYRDTSVAGTTWVPADPLPQGHSYTWWVRAYDSNNVVGPWSASASFAEDVLTAPTLLGPSGTAGPLPTFSWQLVAGANSYDIWVQDLRTGQVVRDMNVDGGTTWTPTTPLLQGDTYKWWVRGVDPNGIDGTWSSSMSVLIQELSAPTLVAPSASVGTLPTFSWNSVSQAVTYEIWVQDLKTGLVTDNTNIAGTTWTPATALARGDPYRWWVRGVDAISSAGPWSSGLDFSVSQLAKPVLAGPSGTSPTLPTFTWSTVANADHYDLWVQDTHTNQVYRNQDVTTNSLVAPAPLLQGDSYVWWVRAIDSNNSPGPWSTSMSFKVASLAAPALVGPSGPTSTQPTLSWSAVADAASYLIWLQDVRTGVVTNADATTGTTWSPASPLAPDDAYICWVRGVDSVNSPGPWSKSLTFTVYTIAAPVLIGPSGSTTASPTFTWNAVTGADHYDIYVQDNRTGVVLRDTVVTTTSWTPAAALNKSDKYTWWVRGIDSLGDTGPWSAALNLTVSA